MFVERQVIGEHTDAGGAQSVAGAGVQTPRAMQENGVETLAFDPRQTVRPRLQREAEAAHGRVRVGGRQENTIQIAGDSEAFGMEERVEDALEGVEVQDELRVAGFPYSSDS